MKVTLLILACLAIGAVNTSPVDKAYMEKQKFLHEMVYRVTDPLQFVEWIKFGSELITDTSKYEVYDEYMINFYELYKLGTLVPKGEFFSGVAYYHGKQTWGLFNFFYYAKDWDTFVRNVAWARLNVNEGMFFSALNLAVIHRPDMKDLILPAVYEIFPQMFFNSKFILKAEKFNMDVWNRQIMLEKELKTIYLKEYPTEIIGNRFYMKDWKTWQWWKLMGLEEVWHLEEKNLLRNNIETFKNDPKYKDVWDGIKAFWMPVDYTRDIEVFNEETKLSYFTEDVDWNAYWYYLNMDYAGFLYEKKFDLKIERRGEWWIYNVQQLLARYYMERLSQGMEEVDPLTLHGTIDVGYDPQLSAYNGNGFTFRKNYFELESYQNKELLVKIQNIDRRIVDIIESGKFVTRDGLIINMTNPESIEYIGSLLQGNIDILDRKFLGYWYTYSNLGLAGCDLDYFTLIPNVLLNYETMVRDPVTYRLWRKAINVIKLFYSQFPPYKHEDLLLPGVKIDDVNVSKLQTFFGLRDTDVTNLLNDKMIFQDGKFVWDKTLLARQLQLNHKPFEVTLKVTAEKVQKVLISLFLAPSIDITGAKIDVFEKRENFMQIDRFVTELTAGENIIKRNSRNFYSTVEDQTTYTELYRYVMLAYDGKQEYPIDIAQSHSGFPNRLILPRGWVKGMPMKLFVAINRFAGTDDQFSTYGKAFNYIDNLPFGYPFDRKMSTLYDILVPNMYIQDIKIYHMEKYQKYYPQKYEHFGSFDYTY